MQPGHLDRTVPPRGQGVQGGQPAAERAQSTEEHHRVHPPLVSALGIEPKQGGSQHVFVEKIHPAQAW